MREHQQPGTESVAWARCCADATPGDEREQAAAIPGAQRAMEAQDCEDAQQTEERETPQDGAETPHVVEEQGLVRYPLSDWRRAVVGLTLVGENSVAEKHRMRRRADSMMKSVQAPRQGFENGQA